LQPSTDLKKKMQTVIADFRLEGELGLRVAN
jgi:hypothetical protein